MEGCRAFWWTYKDFEQKEEALALKHILLAVLAVLAVLPLLPVQPRADTHTHTQTDGGQGQRHCPAEADSDD